MSARNIAADTFLLLAIALWTGGLVHYGLRLARALTRWLDEM